MILRKTQNPYVVNKECLLLQEQWMITSASSKNHILQTYEVKPCVAIAIFYKHPSDPNLNKAALIHYDDSTQHEALEKVLNTLYVQDEISPKDLKVTLIGGWQTNDESRKMANFVRQYFESNGSQVDADKLFAVPIEQQLSDINSQTSDNIMFSVVSVNAKSGEVLISSDYKKVVMTKELLSRLDYYVEQNDNIPLSGVPLYFNCECFEKDDFLSECLEYQETFFEYSYLSDIKNYGGEAIKEMGVCVWQEQYLEYMHSHPANTFAFPSCE